MKLVSKKNGTITIFPSLISAVARKIGFTPPTGMSATNVQSAIEEVAQCVDISNEWTINTTNGNGTLTSFYFPAFKMVYVDVSYTATSACDYDYVIANVSRNYRPAGEVSVRIGCTMTKTTEIVFANGALYPHNGNLLNVSQNGWTGVHMTGLYKV